MILSESFGIDWLEMAFPFEVEIHHLSMKRIPKENVFSVLNLSSEPVPYRPTSEYIKTIIPYFDLILTSDIDLCQNEKSVFLPFGNSWLGQLPNATSRTMRKDFGVSFLYSKGGGRGSNQNIRSSVWHTQDQLTLPIRFYTSTIPGRVPEVSNKVPFRYPDKSYLFRTMFSIVIENHSEPNFFSEKLVDCLIEESIPIYLGCTNITSFFDGAGIIQFTSVRDLVTICNGLKPSDYTERYEQIKRNRIFAMNFSNFCQRLHSIILAAGTKKYLVKKRGGPVL